MNSGKRSVEKISLLVKELETCIREHADCEAKKKKKIENDIDSLEFQVAENAEKLVELDDEIVAAESSSKKNETKKKKKETIKKEEEEEGSEAFVLALLTEECDKEVEKKEVKLKQQAERKHQKEKTRMEKRLQEEIVKVKRENKYICLCCGQIASEMSKCKTCEDAFYCDTICQKSHWLIHQKFCSSNVEKS